MWPAWLRSCVLFVECAAIHGCYMPNCSRSRIPPLLQQVSVTTNTRDRWITLLSRNSVGCVVRVCVAAARACVSSAVCCCTAEACGFAASRLWMVMELSPLQSMVVLLLQGCKVMLLGVLLLNGQDWFVCGFIGAATSARSCALQCSAASALGNQNRTLAADWHLQLPIKQARSTFHNSSMSLSRWLGCTAWLIYAICCSLEFAACIVRLQPPCFDCRGCYRDRVAA